MGQYLLIPFLGGWTSIYQLFWCSPGVQGFDTLPYDFSIKTFVSFRNLFKGHGWDDPGIVLRDDARVHVDGQHLFSDHGTNATELKMQWLIGHYMIL